MKLHWLLFVLGIAAAGWSHADAGTQDALQMPLTEVLAKVATDHPQVKARQLEIRAAQGELDAAQWARYPSLSSQMSTPGSTMPSAIYLQQPLWAGGRIDADIRRADAVRRQSEAALADVRQSLQTQASNAFFDALRLQQRLQYATHNEQEHSKLVALIERRVRADVSPDADLVLARARMQQALTERIQAQRSLDGAFMVLRQLVGASALRLKAPAHVQWSGSGEEQLLALSLSQSGELSRLRLAVEVAQAQEDVAKSNLYPTVSWVHRRTLDQRNNYPKASSYLSLDYKPGSGLSAGAAIEAAHARAQAAAQAIEVQERQIEQLVRNTFAEMTALSLQEPASRELVRDTAEVVASYLRQYQIGRKNWLDVLNALRESTQASYGAADIAVGLQSARVRLMIWAGQITLENMQAIHE